MRITTEITPHVIIVRFSEGVISSVPFSLKFLNAASRVDVVEAIREIPAIGNHPDLVADVHTALNRARQEA